MRTFVRVCTRRRKFSLSWSGTYRDCRNNNRKQGQTFVCTYVLDCAIDVAIILECRDKPTLQCGVTCHGNNVISTSGCHHLRKTSTGCKREGYKHILGLSLHSKIHLLYSVQNNTWAHYLVCRLFWHVLCSKRSNSLETERNNWIS